MGNAPSAYTLSLHEWLEAQRFALGELVIVRTRPAGAPPEINIDFATTRIMGVDRRRDLVQIEDGRWYDALTGARRAQPGEPPVDGYDAIGAPTPRVSTLGDEANAAPGPRTAD